MIEQVLHTVAQWNMRQCMSQLSSCARKSGWSLSLISREPEQPSWCCCMTIMHSCNFLIQLNSRRAAPVSAHCKSFGHVVEWLLQVTATVFYICYDDYHGNVKVFCMWEQLIELFKPQVIPGVTIQIHETEQEQNRDRRKKLKPLLSLIIMGSVITLADKMAKLIALMRNTLFIPKRRLYNDGDAAGIWYGR